MIERLSILTNNGEVLRSIEVKLEEGNISKEIVMELLKDVKN